MTNREAKVYVILGAFALIGWRTWVHYKYPMPCKFESED